MNKSKKDYEKKIKRKVVKFYIHEKELYEYANSINFQKLCKDALRLQYAIKTQRELDRKVKSIKEKMQRFGVSLEDAIEYLNGIAHGKQFKLYGAEGEDQIIDANELKIFIDCSIEELRRKGKENGNLQMDD